MPMQHGCLNRMHVAGRFVSWTAYIETSEPFDATGIYLLLLAGAAAVVLIGPALQLVATRSPATEG